MVLLILLDRTITVLNEDLLLFFQAVIYICVIISLTDLFCFINGIFSYLQEVSRCQHPTSKHHSLVIFGHQSYIRDKACLGIFQHGCFLNYLDNLISSIFNIELIIKSLIILILFQTRQYSMKQHQIRQLEWKTNLLL